jgi:3-methyladenine DNA glycosylase AlkC
VYACGEIGKTDFDSVKNILNVFLNDKHHSVRNALTGAVKQMGEKNPEPVFSWVKEHLNDCSPDMRIKLLHGFELRGRTHPEDILPILNKVKDKHTDKKTRKMLVHIIGQISYKEGCLPRVVAVIKKWGDLIPECREEILKVHKKYKRFSFFNLEEAERYLAANI